MIARPITMPAPAETPCRARQVLPGRYDTTLIADAGQPLTVSGDGHKGATVTRLVIPDPAAEYRFRPADPTRLAALAAATGGELGANASAIGRISESQSARRALWPGLVLGALALWLVDILIRRVRVFE